MLASSLQYFVNARHFVDYFDIDIVGGSSPTLRLDEVCRKKWGFKKIQLGRFKKHAQMMVVDGGSHICSEENMFVVSIYTSEKREKKEVPFSQPSRNHHLLISIHSISGIYDTRWAPTSYKYRVITPFIGVINPSCPFIRPLIGDS